MENNSSRYLIYRLLHRQVQVQERNGKVAKGEVRRVYRNVMEGVVEVTVGEKDVVFQEPSAICLEGEDVVFSYGRAGLTDDSDELLWAEVREGATKGESLGDVLKRTAPAYRHETRFFLAPREPVLA
jgi:hypothetical protein